MIQIRKFQLALLLLLIAAIGFIYLSLPSALDADLRVKDSAGHISKPPPKKGAKIQQAPTKNLPHFEVDEFGETSESKFGKAPDRQSAMKPKVEKVDKAPQPEIIKAPANTSSEDVRNDEEWRHYLDSIRGLAPDKLEPKGHKIVLLTASDGKGHNSEIKDLFRNVNENREEYCAYHSMFTF